MITEIENRLNKNIERLEPIARKLGVECYRIYDRDIPDYPFMVDRYGHFVIIHDRRTDFDFDDPKKAEHLDLVKNAVVKLLVPEDVIVKRRERQRVDNIKERQYERMAATGHRYIVRESDARFIVNLYDYLDTGLFLDHRRLRERVYKRVKPGVKFLNLFSYTGSVSVFAALAGARVTSVDMSNTYTQWAMDNFRENDIDVGQHDFITEDVLNYLSGPAHGTFDLIFLDPPTFSNSKRMEGTFEVERDQVNLIANTMRFIAPGGILIFSNNKRTFKLADEIKDRYQVVDISKATLPFDFRDTKIRSVFEIKPRGFDHTQRKK